MSAWRVALLVAAVLYVGVLVGAFVIMGAREAKRRRRLRGPPPDNVTPLWPDV